MKYSIDLDIDVEEIGEFNILSFLLKLRSKLRNMVWFGNYESRLSVYNVESDLPNTLSLWDILADIETELLRITVINLENTPQYFYCDNLTSREYCLINLADKTVRLFIEDGDRKSEISDGRSRAIDGITLCQETVFDISM